MVQLGLFTMEPSRENLSKNKNYENVEGNTNRPFATWLSTSIHSCASIGKTCFVVAHPFAFVCCGYYTIHIGCNYVNISFIFSAIKHKHQLRSSLYRHALLHPTITKNCCISLFVDGVTAGHIQP